MTDTASLAKLVAQLNSGIALLTWPFVVYESLSKHSQATELKPKLDLRRDQLLSDVVLEIEEALVPYWPRAATRIILEGHDEDDVQPTLSENARDAITNCLSKHEKTLIRTNSIRSLARRILRFDKYTYWCLFFTGVLALTALALWCFIDHWPTWLAALALVVPVLSSLITATVAACRQTMVHHAQSEIIEEAEL